ncbi:MAG: ABC transporter substrate-binding protein [Alicyclobacillus sp.]|nr:ABC transporter substrate-binding protein [Alicyclobacillus sp.]
MTGFRIASICPSNTELLAALGLTPYLVGVDNYSDYPTDALSGLPRLGPDLHIRVNELVALQPDLVVSSHSVPGMERVTEAVATAGLRQLILSPHSIADILADLETLAAAVPASILPPSVAARTVARLRERIERVGEWTGRVQGADRPRLYWEWWPNPVFSPAQDNWLTELSHLAGAVNIFRDFPGDQVQDDGRRVAELAPDYFLAVWTGIPQHKVPLAKIQNRKDPWPKTPAFQRQQLYVLSEGLYCRPSQRLIDGLEQLTGLLHPEAVSALGLQPPATYAPVRCWNGTWL